MRGPYFTFTRTTPCLLFLSRGWRRKRRQSWKMVNRKWKRLTYAVIWWPNADSKDGSNVTTIIRNGSTPDQSDQNKWNQLPGFHLGTYDSYEAAERALNQRVGNSPTSDEEDSQCTQLGGESCMEPCSEFRTPKPNLRPSCDVKTPTDLVLPPLPGLRDSK